ncbi:Dendritic cell-specific transmembrane protein-like [Cinara cedri]|uniref:Dendritic cell-specific transmembrane protein-like n=1 Tax=Cinara cedri TaxID=506608 RepID=A0A5E4MCW7_9HEMI|nr:Dendritic cell-specific transmembrane protein-like [Cinara cedri]
MFYISEIADRRSKKFRKSKLILGFFYGIFLSLILYHFIIVDLELSDQSTRLMGIVISLFLSVGHAISQQIRCLGLLSMPTFFDKTGQRVLVAMVFAYIMAGPLNNMMRNGSEVLRVFTCSGALVYNLTKIRYELMFKPFQEALFKLKAETNEIKEIVNSINDVIDPISQEFESDNEDITVRERNDYLDDQMGPSKKDEHMKKMYKKPEPDEVEKKYKDKLQRKCKNIITRADNKCKAAFQQSFDQCKDSVHWAVSWALCWPMKVTFVCNLAPLFGGADVCNSGKSVNSGFGKGYVYLTKSKDELKREFLHVKVNYKLNKMKIMPDQYRDAFDATRDMVMDFGEKRRAAEFVIVCIRRLLAFSFLKILLDSQNYMHKYLTDIEHDNKYITKYYCKIDNRRKKSGKHTLLPLKNTEKHKMVDLRSYRLMKSECDNLWKSVIKLVFEIIAATSLVLLDMIFYEALDVIRRHAKIDYFQTGHHDLQIKVKGTGMIANLLRSVLDRFNFQKNVTVNLSNEMCLPSPHKLDTYYIYKIYGTFLLVFVMTVFAGYTNRVKRLICAIYFRKREKRRVLYLYNETLRKRTAFFRYMKKKVMKLARENKLKEDLNVYLVLRLRCPRVFGWLVRFPCSRRKCLICGEPETAAGKQYGCDTAGCVYVHCRQCWEDVQGECYGCSDTFREPDDGRDVESDCGRRDAAAIDGGHPDTDISSTKNR